jgi:hypothetical protein
MDIVLGVSMAPTSVRMLLVQGENADGATVEDHQFAITTDDEAATLSAADQVISAILGTREGAAEAGHALTSTGVTWTDPVDAAALHEALATRKIENVMLVSAFLAAAALAQTVGTTVGDTHTALLFLEPDTATLALVDSADGSISEVHKELIPGHSVAELASMLAGLEELETRPQSVFIVGTGVDVAAIKPQLETVTALPITAAEEPETALAWGAALASANAPLFASSTAALAYAQDPGTGAVDPFAVSPGYLVAPDVPLGTEIGEDDLAYSAVPDEEADAHTVEHDELEIHTVAQDVLAEDHLDGDPQRERGPLVLVGSILAVLFVAAALSLEVALALGIRPSVALLPRPLQNLIIQNPAPAPVPEAAHSIAPAVIPAPARLPIAAPPPAVHLPAPAAPPIPVPAAPPVPIVAPVPAVVPLPVPVRAPAPVHIAPLPVPVRIPSPVHVPQPPIHMPIPQNPVQINDPGPPMHMPAPWEGPHGPESGGPGMHGPGGFGGPPGGMPGFGGPGGFGGPPVGNPGGFGGPPGGMPGFGGPGGFGGPPGGMPGFGGGNPGFGGPGGFGGPPGGGMPGFGGPGVFGGIPGLGGGHGFGGGPFGGGGFGGGGFGGGGFGGGGHSFGGGGHGGGGHH